MPGTNFKNLKDLKILNTLKIRKKLKFDRDKLKTHETKAGIDSITKIKSSLFQLELK